MEKQNKIIIIISLLIILLSIYAGGYFMHNLKNDNKKITKNSTKKETNEVPNDNKKAMGKEITIAVNDNESFQFYILSENDSTYTLLAKESLGSIPYYTADNCNINNESGCDISDEATNIINLLHEKTATWTNVGEIRLPTYEDINNLLTTNDFVHEVSYWLNSNSEIKNNKVAYYVNNEQKTIEKDKLYNNHELIVVITVLKSFEK